MNPTWSSTRLNRRQPHKQPPERPEAHLTLFGIAALFAYSWNFRYTSHCISRLSPTATFIYGWSQAPLALLFLPIGQTGQRRKYVGNSRNRVHA